jgi:hypothetical protein
MFPRSFNARVAQRMAIWGAMVGFLLFLYAATEIIQAWKMAAISTEMRGAIAATTALSQSDAGKVAAATLDAVYGREIGLLANNRQNKLLIALLALFVIGWPCALRGQPKRCAAGLRA